MRHLNLYVDKHITKKELNNITFFFRFFLDDDEKLEDIKKQYTSGELLTGELKKILIDTLTPVLTSHQHIRSQISDETLQTFMTPRKLC